MVTMNKRAAIAKSIDEQNAANQVVIYSKTYCPYCRATKQLFREAFPNAKVKVVEMDTLEDGVQFQQVLLAKTGQRTVPNVYVNNRHVGGNSDVQQAYANGTLTKLLQQQQPNKNQAKETSQRTKQEKLRALIQQANQQHDVVIWSKSYCPYCRAAKQLFAAKTGLDVAIYEMDEMPHGDVLQDELETMTGQRTVPNIFVKGKPVGGNSDVQELARTAALDKLLQQSS